MKLAVCEAGGDMEPGGDEWRFLARASAALEPEILLLNENPFGPWIAARRKRDDALLRTSVEAHEAGIRSFAETRARAVLGTRPVLNDGRSVIEGFVWESGVLRSVHTKQYLPEEEGFYERTWFERGEGSFTVADSQGIKVGFLIGSEVMFNEWARFYGRQGAEVIAVPRATAALSWEKWKAALSMAAIVSGCYVMSSNRLGRDEFRREFDGRGCVVNPHGVLIAETSGENPVAWASFEREMVLQAKGEHPCNIPER